tara:strand:- start:407 stop:565 length:159 start_codon:yes stop_codon:yes gene_type:complete
MFQTRLAGFIADGFHRGDIPADHAIAANGSKAVGSTGIGIVCIAIITVLEVW